MEAPFPPLMLPSLVENAIKHGLEPQREGGTVDISAALVDGTLRMIVADTGRGFADTPGHAAWASPTSASASPRSTATRPSSRWRRNEPHGVVATIEVPGEGARPGAAPPLRPPQRSRAVAAGAAADAPPRARSPRWARAERAWRKGLSFAFVVLVVRRRGRRGPRDRRRGHRPRAGADRRRDHRRGHAARSSAPRASRPRSRWSCSALAIVLAVVYGLGFLFVGLAIFIPLVILVSLFPVLAPFILLGLGIWWLVRRAQARWRPPTRAPPRTRP